jgi:hypothetical protein
MPRAGPRNWGWNQFDRPHSDGWGRSNLARRRHSTSASRCLQLSEPQGPANLGEPTASPNRSAGPVSQKSCSHRAYPGARLPDYLQDQRLRCGPNGRRARSGLHNRNRRIGRPPQTGKSHIRPRSHRAATSTMARAQSSPGPSHHRNLAPSRSSHRRSPDSKRAGPRGPRSPGVRLGHPAPRVGAPAEPQESPGPAADRELAGQAHIAPAQLGLVAVPPWLGPGRPCRPCRKPWRKRFV